MLISRSKKVQGRSQSCKEGRSSSPIASIASSNCGGRDSTSSCDGECAASIPVPPKRNAGAKYQALKKCFSHEGSTTSNGEVTNGTESGPDIDLVLKQPHLGQIASSDKDNDKENEIDGLQTKNVVRNSMLQNGFGSLIRKESGGGGSSGTVSLLESNDQSNGGNGGQGSDDNHDNDISSPEASLQPLGTVVPPIATVTAASRQSLKHLSASAPAIQTNLRAMGSDSELTLAPSSSKSRQKKFHRHFKTVAPDEKVLDYYSCALVGDILLQGYLYITENNFAFYSNVFGYVTKLLIPVCSVVRITKERTAKIIPNAVGICTRSEKHVFASLLSRDTTYKLMCKVWNYSIDQEAKEVLKITSKLKEEDKCSGDLSVPDESSAESGSGNDSTIEPSSPSTGKIPAPKALASNLPGSPSGRSNLIGSQSSSSLKGLSVASLHPLHASASTASIVGTAPSTSATTGTSTTFTRIPHRTSVVQANHPVASLATFSNKKSSESEVKGRGPSLILLATALLVILFLSAALLLNRISNLQDKLSLNNPTFRDSDQFYQELLLWQNKLHSSSAEEIHQYINMNLQQIIRVRQSLEALSLLFMSSQAENAKISEGSYQSHSQSKE